MQNPEGGLHTIDAATIYSYNKHTNIPWNVTEYHTPREQMDVELQIKKRKWASQKKGEKDTKYVTKRGFYMDYDLKVAKGVPSGCDHGAQKEWQFKKWQKIAPRIKVDPKLIKETYLDHIQIDQLKRKVPGICTYSLQKSLKQKDLEVQELKKKKVLQGEKHIYFQNTEELAASVPGPGNYSPHMPHSPHRLDKSDYKFWVEKHKKEKERDSKKDGQKPSSCSHSPMNMTLSTFDRIAAQSKKPSKKLYLGGDTRFEYNRPNKKKIIQTRPAPATYNTLYQWRSKDSSPKKALWNDMVYRGHSMTIYH